MKKIIAIFVSTIFLILTVDSQTVKYFGQQYGYIPQPVKVEQGAKNKAFHFQTDKTKIFAPENCQAAKYLQEMISSCCLNAKPLHIKKNSSRKDMVNGIVFLFTSEKKLGKEGYIIDVEENNIVIQSNEEAGMFYAVQTFWQMIGHNFALENYNPKHTKLQSMIIDIPLQHIEDYPRFSYRGKHLDCARHFFPASFIKEYLDILAFHKINTFHWHLTDDQGWRIEIKKYPLLTEISSKRHQTLVGHYSDNEPDKQVFDGQEYKGYYTQEEIKDIVEYAKQRHITIIPEIELPGHSLSALAAYPELSCKEKPLDVACTWGVFEDVFCSNEESFSFLKNVLDEVMDLFPSKYIHIGGDETPTTRWQECQKCQKIMKENNFTDVNQIQGYFTKRIGDYLQKHDRKIIGWDEILAKGVDTAATIMSWQGVQGGINAAKRGNDVVMAASAYLYFNFYQGESYAEPLSFGGFTPLKKVYTFEPVSDELTKEQAKHIIGIQACTWTEYIKDSSLLLYNDLPRLAAMSERAWSEKNVKDYDDFVSRLNGILDIYDHCGLNYAKSHFAVTSIGKIAKDGLEISLSSALKDAAIYYTLDGSLPTDRSIIYTKPFIINKDLTVKAVVYKNHHLYSPLFKAEYHINKATGKHYKMFDINPQYNGGASESLTDGLLGNKKSFERWIGTLGKDYDVVVDLEKKQPINSISINFLNEEDSWIFLPKEVHFFISSDDKHWKEILEVQQSEVKGNPKVVKYQVFCQENARYVYIKGVSIGNCPDNHPGKGYPAHTFADEIEVK